MERIQLPQQTYDNLITKLKQNARALKDDPFFVQMAAKLERNAKTSHDGVSVPLLYMKTAYEGLKNNLARKGEKYDTNLDRLVLMELDEAVEVHEAVRRNAVTEPQPSSPQGPLAGDGSLALDPEKTGFWSVKERAEYQATAKLIALMDPY